MGTTHFDGNQTRFLESEFIRGIEDPGGLVLLDEITRASLDAFNLLMTVLLVISDGQPQGTGYTGEFAVEHIRSVVESLRKDVRIIQIAIGPVVESSRMFRHSIVFSDLNLWPTQIGELLKRLLRAQTIPT